MKFILQKIFLILLILVNLYSVYIHISIDFLNNTRQTYLATYSWILGILFFLIYIFLTSKNKNTNQIRQYKLEKLLFVILIIGFAFRLYKYNYHGLYLDEWYWLTNAKEILSGLVKTPFGFIGDQPSNLPAYFVAFFLYIFNSSYLAVRLPGIIYSVFTILFIFLFLKDNYGKKPAIIGAIFLSTSIWDIHMSQLGWNNVNINPFLISGGMYFFSKGLKNNSAKNIIFGSIFLGISINLLYISVLNVLAIGIYSIFVLVRNNNKINVLKLLLLATFTIYLVSFPTLIKIFKYPNGSISRHQIFLKENLVKSKGNIYYYTDQIKLVLLDFVPNNNRYNIQMLWGITLEPIILLTLIIGIISVFAKFYKPESILIIANFVLMFVPIVVLSRTTSIWREIGFLPSIYIISAIGAGFIAEKITKIKYFLLYKKRAYIILLLIYLSSFIYFFNIYYKYILIKEDNVYETYCKKTADYIELNIPKKTIILLPNEMCNQLISIALLDKYKYLTYDSFQEINNYQLKKLPISVVKITETYSSSQFSKEISLNSFNDYIDSVDNKYKIGTVTKADGSTFSVVYLFN